MGQKITFNYPWYNALIVIGIMYSFFNSISVIISDSFLLLGLIVLSIKILGIYLFFKNSKYFSLIYRTWCLFYIIPFLFPLVKFLYQVFILNYTFTHNFNFYINVIIFFYFTVLLIESWGRIEMKLVKVPDE